MKIPFRKKISLLLILLVLVFLLLNLTGSYLSVKNFFYNISSPLEVIFWQWGEEVSGFLGVFSKQSALLEEVKELSFKNQELLGEVAFLRELKKENEVLREALNLGLEKDFQLEIARVIAKDISQDSLLVDKGKKAGLLSGMPLISPQKVLVGRISQVYEDFSEVILISHKDSSFDAKLSDREVFGLIEGRGAFKVYLDLVSKEELISEGELVVTTALGGIFPPGILVGEVKNVRKTDIDPFQTAEIEPQFQVKELDYLFIITSF